ncbi:hypothetical protein PspLS_05770 [Pyricularia sp. CBS 133598]|nr:hypothetical protein PspLS_05770 [Pyricularia sp. CBS 133598]
MATRKVRYKKLNVKTPLPVLLFSEIDSNEYEALKNEQIQTGVESAEENEYHLQAVLSTTGVAADKEIPVTQTQESNINYDELYPTKFVEPTNYIRFSQTVEECIGCPYDMTEDDEAFLAKYNKDLAAGTAALSEDDFEKIMFVFEDTASVQAPYAAVDNTVVSYDHMVPPLTELELPKLMLHAKAIYEHWKSQRQAKKGPLHPTLKFETHQESDDLDPFVCFRRREVRQTRKTRARDTQIADKLKRLRRELEEGRELIALAHGREVMKREMLHVDRAIFEQRCNVKKVKIKLGIKTDDEDLYNTKPQRKKPAEAQPVQQRAAAGPARVAPRSDTRASDVDLGLLSELKAQREEEMRVDIETKIENHKKWNEKYVDLTNSSLADKKPETEQEPQPAKWRPVKVQYLMTPPNSASAEDLEEPEPMELDAPEPAPIRRFHGLSADDDDYSPDPMEYRRRVGRLNRLWVDRRPVKKQLVDVVPTRFPVVNDRWKYDCDSSDDEDSVYEVDPFDLRALKFRATIPLGSAAPRRIEGSAAAPVTNGTARPALPWSGGGQPPSQQPQQQQQQQPQPQPQVQPSA